MERPRQAVILAGGRGNRLRPLTDRIPKPMIEFHGKPFLDYLLELLREQGCERILLLLGYLSKVIQAYVGDGGRWGLTIESCVSDVEDETGRRLRLAAPRIEPVFLLMYCDNFWPMRFDRMWARFCSTHTQGMLTVYENADRYSHDNVQVDGDGFVSLYDKDRTAQGLRGVEIGYALFRHEVLDRLPDENASFERVVYPQLVAERQLQAFVTRHRYYSVSTPDRLEATAQFLTRRPAVILDRDGVLNKRPPRAQYVRSWSDWEWLPGALEALRSFREAGYRVIVVSNQAGISRGELTAEGVEAIHQQMRAEAEAVGGAIDAVYHCPHGWDDGCGCRKPKPGMLYEAQRDFHLDLSRACFIGDDERDGQAADAAGCPFALVSETRSLLDAARELIDRTQWLSVS